MITRWNPPVPLLNTWLVKSALSRLTQASNDSESPTSSVGESGTTTSSSTPSSDAAVFPTMTPGTLSVGPPPYVPALRLPDPSVAVVPVASPKLQQPTGASVASHAGTCCVESGGLNVAV